MKIFCSPVSQSNGKTFRCQLQGHFVRSRSISSMITGDPGDEVDESSTNAFNYLDDFALLSEKPCLYFLACIISLNEIIRGINCLLIMKQEQQRSKATITRCDLSSRFFCIDATLLCEFESDKI